MAGLKNQTWNKHLKHKIFSIFCLFGLAACATHQSGVYARKTPYVEHKEAVLAVATAEKVASEAASEMIDLGGNIADAAVAASFAISVVRPQSTGLGGGGFLLYYDAKRKEATAWDFRESAPSLAHSAMYLEKGQVISKASTEGAMAVGVPGLVAGLYEFHKSYGRLTWFQVLQPAIRAAENGAQVSEHLAKALERKSELLQKDLQIQTIFYPRGEALKAGDIFIQQNLAKTLQNIAIGGRDYFYQGEFANRLESWMKDHHGILQKKDMELYTVKKRQPLQERWRDYQVITMPPPSSGGVHLVQILKIFDEIPRNFSSEVADGNFYIGKMIAEVEAMKRAFADRAVHLGDSDFADVPLMELLKDGYLERRAEEIQKLGIIAANQIQPWNAPESVPEEKTETTHLSFMDSEGNAISTTQTINGWFGAGVMLPETGVVLNNEMDDFSIQPGIPNLYGLVGGESNKVEAHKRPLSSMTPTIVLDRSNDVKMVLGAPGGSTIITSVYYVLSRVLRDGKSIQEALSDCRFHHQWLPDQVSMEPECLQEYDELSKYYVLKESTSFGEVEVVGRNDGKVYAATDPRGDGLPLVVQAITH